MNRCITYVTFTYVFPSGLRGCLLKYRLHSLADAAPYDQNTTQTGQIIALGSDGTGQK